MCKFISLEGLFCFNRFLHCTEEDLQPFIKRLNDKASFRNLVFSSLNYRCSCGADSVTTYYKVLSTNKEQQQIEFETEIQHCN